MNSSDPRRLTVRTETWPLRGTFTISRGAKSAAEVVVVELVQGGVVGRGECVPYPRYGESPDSVVELIEGLRTDLERDLTPETLQSALPPGAARNALDCALWDLIAKQSAQPVWRLAGVPAPRVLTTAYTLSLEAPETMAASARAAADRPLLKLKLGADGDLERVQAVRASVPNARLIIDANEAWTPAILQDLAPALAAARIELIEQPLPADADQALADLTLPIPVCADESVHDRATLAGLADRYDFVNIKLDKTGGLTEALAMARAAADGGLGIMVGCMIGTSLAMAPAFLVGLLAAFVDLDGPLLLASDRDPGISYRASEMQPPPVALWG